MAVLERKELEGSPLSDLHAIASELGIEGYRRLRKEQLPGPAGVRFKGPAVIDQLDTTTLVPPGVQAEVDEYLNIRLEVS